jgi:hypothetical protein
MSNNPPFSGLEDEDKSLIEAVWNEPDSSLVALIRAGQLDPKTDFVRKDFRGWPLTGQDVRGIDFTESDLRGTGIEHAIRDETTILTGAKLDEFSKINKPTRLIERKTTKRTSGSGHWHAGVHKSFGNELYLILLRLVTGSLFMRDNIVENLKSAGVTDYMIFSLYSHWDIAIRAWGSDRSIQSLKRHLNENREINRLHPPKFYKLNEVVHFPDRKFKYPSIEDVRASMTRWPTEQLKQAQETGRGSVHDALMATGLILNNDTRFTDDRIQFYIFINSAEPAPRRFRDSLLRVVNDSRNIRSKTAYFTSDGPTHAVVKGQVLPARFYDIFPFLRHMTDQLEDSLGTYIDTETMLIASQDVRHSALIDFDNAPRDPSTLAKSSAIELVTPGEGTHTEFKSTLRFNLRSGQEDKRMEQEVLKTIAAFLNTKGGTLMIGVGDDGKALGLDADKFTSEDKMNLHLVNLIRDRIGPHHMISVRPRFDNLDEKRILIVECTRGLSPAFVRDGNIEHFFIRTGAATTELSGSQLQEFLKVRFQ